MRGRSAVGIFSLGKKKAEQKSEWPQFSLNEYVSINSKKLQFQEKYL